MAYWYRVETDAPVRHPVMLFLHGYAETGGEPVEQTSKHGPWWAANPAVVPELRDWFRVAPHIAEKGGTWNRDDLVGLVQDVSQHHADVVSNGLSVIGISRGGWGVLDLVSACPADIAVLGTVVFCPEHVNTVEAALERAPMLLFHCEADSVVTMPKERRELYDRLRTRPNFHWVNVHTTWTLGERRHNCWTMVLERSGVYEWLRGLRTNQTYGSSRDRWPDFTSFERARPVET